MKFTQSCTITADRQTVWDFLMNMQNVANCLTGVQTFTPLDADTYEGTLRVKVPCG
jgi:carbon monoxide dehydrogenase subunit G